MKKVNGVVAFLCMCVVAGGVALTACNDGGNGGESGGGREESKPIDEQTWLSAFEGLDYTNCSIRSDSGNMIMLSENAVYAKNQIGDEYLNEFYSVKKEDGTFITYVRDFYSDDDGTIEDAKFFIDRYTTFEQAVALAKDMVPFKVSYKDYYAKFNYDKTGQKYIYNDTIEIIEVNQYSGLNYMIDDTSTYHFVDNIVKIENDKIISCSFRINWYSCICHCVNQPDHNEAGTNVDMTIEFYDFGTTTVIVPPEVIAEAIENTYN